MASPRAPFLAAALALLALGACERAEAYREAPEIRAERLPGGAVRVRNLPPSAGATGYEWRWTEELRIGARDGEGPGEFENAHGVALAPDQTLTVADPANQRFTRFDRDGRLLATLPTSFSGYRYTWEGGYDHGGRLYDAVPVRVAQGVGLILRRFDPALQANDDFLLPSDAGNAYYELPRGSFLVPFHGEERWVLDPAGFVWLARTDEYRIVKRTPAGGTVLVVEMGRPPVPVSRAERDSVVRRIQTIAQGMGGGDPDPGRIPRHKPPIETLDLDDAGRLWVRLYADGPEARWDVYDPEGRYQASASLPVRIPSYWHPIIRDGLLFTLVLDEMDVPYIVRARLDAPAAPGDPAVPPRGPP